MLNVLIAIGVALLILTFLQHSQTGAPE